MYKVIQDGMVIDAIKYPKFIRFLSSGHIALTDRSSAHGVVGSDNKTFYGFAPVQNLNLPIISLVKTDEAEFNRLISLLNSGKPVCEDEGTLEESRHKKLESLSDTCKNKITNGFTVKLSDRNYYAFRLTAEDQLNLMQIESRLASGETSFVYHATNQPCKSFSREDMYKIVRAFRKHVLYHTTYYNAAKQYIKQLTDIRQINRFRYGQDICKTVEDAAIKQILRNGDAC